MLRETTLVRLPAPLSKAIDGAVDNFLQKHEAQKVKAHKRWQGADLWMVFKDQVSGAEEGVIVTHRVTIAAYSDDPGRLVFIPDIVKTTPAGRYILEETRRASLVHKLAEKLAEKKSVLYVHEAEWQLASPREDWGLRMKRVMERVMLGLRDAWQMAQSVEASEATVLLP